MHRSAKPAVAAMVIAATSLSGCSAVNTKAEVGTFDVSPNKELKQGLAYYLPKNLIRITFVRGSESTGDAVANLIKARIAHQKAQELAQLAQAAAEEAERQFIGAPPSVAADLRKVADLKKAAHSAAVARANITGVAARRAEAAVGKMVASGAPGIVASDSISVDIEAATADTRYRFILSGVHLPTQDSVFRFAVNDLGLLQTATTKVQDRLPEIASNASRTVLAGVFGYAPGKPADPISYGPLIVDEALARELGSAKAIADIEEAVTISGAPGEFVSGRTGSAEGVSVTGVARRIEEKARSDRDRSVAAPPAAPAGAPGVGGQAKSYLDHCTPMEPSERLKPKVASWLIDPQRPASIAFVNCELQKLGSNLRVRVLAWPDARASALAHVSKIPEGSGNHAGIVYRAPVDYKIAVVEMRWTGKYRAVLPASATEGMTREQILQASRAVGDRCKAEIERREKSRSPTSNDPPSVVLTVGTGTVKAPCIRESIALTREENNFVLPNGGALRLLPFRYSICSIAGYQVQFVDGQPVRQTIDHRSELAACSAIPLQIMNDILEAPIKAFDFSARRAESERKARQAQEELEKARRIPGTNPAAPAQ